MREKGARESESWGLGLRGTVGGVYCKDQEREGELQRPSIPIFKEGTWGIKLIYYFHILL